MKTLLIYLFDEYIGKLYVEEIRGKEEFSFSFSDDYLLDKNSPIIDPELFKYSGRQYSSSGVFGFVNDMIPDRFGRLLIEREEIEKSIRDKVPAKKLQVSDYLLRVSDLSRMGGLRIKTEIDGPFLNNDKNTIPPYMYLREIENASLKIDANEPIDEKVYRNLLLPGSSLGGARPKANVYYEDQVFIAKFPTKNDNYDVELLEYIVGEIARKCEIDVPIYRLEKYSNYGHTLLVKRFDRVAGKRIHYISAMTALGARDGDSETYSYIDLVDFIKSNSKNCEKNLKELYKRMIFTFLINDTDNHLRNHAFILSGKQYELSPMFDVNPTLFETSFELSMGENKKEIIEWSKYFDIAEETANSIYNRIGKIIVDQLMDYKNKYTDVSKEIDVLLQITKSRL